MDVWYHIALKFNDKDLITLLLICKYITHVIDNERFWKEKCFDASKLDDQSWKQFYI